MLVLTTHDNDNSINTIAIISSPVRTLHSYDAFFCRSARIKLETVAVIVLMVIIELGKMFFKVSWSPNLESKYTDADK